MERRPLSGNQRPDLLTSLMNMSFVLRLPRKCIFADPLQMSHACHHSWKCYKTLTFWSLLTRCTIPCTCHAKRHLNLQTPKVARTFGALHILTSKCASRHNGVHFFDVATSMNGPTLMCFVHFDFEKCFAPQRRALFLTSQLPKWSEHVVLCTF